jgi:hypothetical protein
MTVIKLPPSVWAEVKPEDSICVTLDVDSTSDVQRIIDSWRTVDLPLPRIELGQKLLYADDLRQSIKRLLPYFSRGNDKSSTVGRLILGLNLSGSPIGVAKVVELLSDFEVGYTIEISSGLDSLTAATHRQGKSRAIGLVTPPHVGVDEARELGYTRNFRDLGYLSGLASTMVDAARHRGVRAFLCSHLDVAISSSAIKKYVYARVPWDGMYQPRVGSIAEAVSAGAEIIFIRQGILYPPERIGSPEKALRLVYEEVIRAREKSKKRGLVLSESK